MTKNILMVLAVVIAIEGGFIAWNMYDARDDVKIAQEAITEQIEWAREETERISLDLRKDLIRISNDLGTLEDIGESNYYVLQEIESISCRQLAALKEGSGIPYGPTYC